MSKKSFLTLTTLFLLPAVVFFASQIVPQKQLHGFGMAAYGQEMFTAPSSASDVLLKYKHLSARQLLDTANYYYNKNYLDSALICYSLLANMPVKDSDVETQQLIIEAFNKSGVVYYHICDYQKSSELLIKGLDLCEKYRYDEYKSRFYNNLGNIYYRFGKYDMAEPYYLQALNQCTDSTGVTLILNNLGATNIEIGKLDSAFYFLDQSLQISNRYNNTHLYIIQSTIAEGYQKIKQYDSAFHHYRLSLDDAKKKDKIENEAENLSNLGKLFFEINKTDSALFYINLSNTIAVENSFQGILAENYLVLSKIEELKGRNKNALAYFKRYANLRDSVFDVDKFGQINQLQRLYEVSKTNQQIEQLSIEQQIKERTIRYQKIILFIAVGVLLLVSGVLLVVFFAKRNLNTAYKALFEKNLKIIELQENAPRKYAKSTFTDNMQQELLNRILTIMEDVSVICDPKFSIDRLAELVQSNQNYVSQVINHTLEKNFRSFLNSYRIREAQRIFSEPDAEKYTIESIALRVGYKSQSTFYGAFKEITGVSPLFYLKSIQAQRKLI